MNKLHILLFSIFLISCKNLKKNNKTVDSCVIGKANYIKQKDTTIISESIALNSQNNFDTIRDGANRIDSVLIIKDTLGFFSKDSDILSIITILKYYKVVIPPYKYTCIEKVHSYGDKFVTWNLVLFYDSQYNKKFSCSFNHHISLQRCVYYSSNKDSVEYLFYGGELHKSD